MDALVVALLAFAAGFLTCALLVGVLIWWSFSDRRVQRVNLHLAPGGRFQPAQE